MQGAALIELLVLVARLIDRLLDLAVERQKAGNLEALRSAIQTARNAKTEDERREANRKIREAFERR